MLQQEILPKRKCFRHLGKAFPTQDICHRHAGKAFSPQVNLLFPVEDDIFEIIYVL